VWSESILHVDMDSFFVEVERLDRPDLRGRPVAVGGVGGRGVIASASYEARRFGVQSAQATAVAVRLCPDLVVVSPAHNRYGEMSLRVFEVFRSVTPLVEGLSLDEAFLDVSGLRRHFASPVVIGEEIRTRLKSELGLPASVGVASTKFVAKLASEAAKPDGLRHVSIDEQEAFLHALPVEALWGVGPATLAGLQKLGITTVGDLAAVPQASLNQALGPSQGAHLLALAAGVDPRPVVPETGSKSISVEETYSKDIENRQLAEAALMAHSQQLAARLRRAGLGARTISLKVRFTDFATVTRSRTLPHSIDQARDLYRIAVDLLAQVPEEQAIRLLGLAGSSLESFEGPDQMSLDSDDAWHRIGDAVAEVQDRFGVKAIEPARLLGDCDDGDTE
jgi:DNA polymerase IV